MPVEQREQVTRVEVDRVNWQQEEPAGFGGRRQPSLGGTSRVNREVYARFCERLGVRVPGPTRRGASRTTVSGGSADPALRDEHLERWRFSARGLFLIELRYLSNPYGRPGTVGTPSGRNACGRV